MFPSSINPSYVRMRAMPYGRQLRGLGELPDTQQWGDSWSGDDESVRKAQQEDDVVGNGIFDGPGAPPTGNAGAGVFEHHFALPGYLYREQPTQPSEIIDTTTGQPVIYQPNAGGSWYDDVVETYRSYDLETERPYSTNPAFGPVRMPEVASSSPPLSGLGMVRGAPTDTRYAFRGLGDAQAIPWGEYAAWAGGGVLFGVALAFAINYFTREE
jgi:hypothetical protein